MVVCDVNYNHVAFIFVKLVVHDVSYTIVAFLFVKGEIRDVNLQSCDIPVCQRGSR